VTVGARSDPLVIWTRDSVQVGLCIARAIRDVAEAASAARITS
jgi:hypothetical protein